MIPDWTVTVALWDAWEELGRPGSFWKWAHDQAPESVPDDLGSPQDWAQFLGTYCAKHETRIYVRDMDPVTGRWRSVCFADLDLERQRRWIAMWYSQGRVPVRLSDRVVVVEE